MGGASELEVSRILDISDIDFVFPKGFSFFEPYLRYHVKEVLEIGGEAYVSRNPEGAISGLFIYDPYEKTGTIYTRSREVFDYYFYFRTFNFLFSEMSTEHESEVFDIYTADLENILIDHRFRYEISVADEKLESELERFMTLTHPGINRRWVGVALRNGDRCFTVMLGSEIAGVGWLSLVNGVGRFHSLYVKPQYRGMGIAEDILYARLLWLKSKRARSVFSEISRHNVACSRVEMKGQMRVTGQVYQYFGKERREAPERSAQPLGAPHLGQTMAVESINAPQYLQ